MFTGGPSRVLPYPFSARGGLTVGVAGEEEFLRKIIRKTLEESPSTKGEQPLEGGNRKRGRREKLVDQLVTVKKRGSWPRCGAAEKPPRTQKQKKAEGRRDRGICSSSEA